MESFNIAIISGALSSAAEIRVLPSEQRMAQFQLTTRVDGRAMSVPVSMVDPPVWILDAETGDEVIVLGAVRRRFFRAAGTTASRVEVEAETVVRGSDRARCRKLQARVEEAVATALGSA